MRTREGGKEVVESELVRDVGSGEAKSHFVSIAVKEIIFSNSKVEEISGSDSRWVVVVIFGVWLGDVDEARCETIRIALRKA